MPHLVSRREFVVDAAVALGSCVLCRLCRGEQMPGHPQEPGPHEAAYYEKLGGKRIQCRLCPRACVVPDGGRGYCRVRENRGGTYYSLVYGRPCVTNIDPIEKKPFFHVYPGTKAYSIATVGCNLQCKFCQNWDISQASPEDVPTAYKSPKEIAAAASKAGVRTIAYTYSEPTVFYEYVADCARAGRDAGLESVVVSAGFISADPLKALVPLVKAIKIDLKAFTQSFYADTCDGQLQPVLDTLKRLSGSGVWYEIVVLLIPTLNDNADDVKRMSAWVVKELGPDVPVHFTRFHPEYKLRNLPPTPPQTLSKARQIAIGEGCHFAYTGNAPGLEGQETVCPSCKQTVVKRYGYTIQENKIKNGKCGNCGAAIPGVWS